MVKKYFCIIYGHLLDSFTQFFIFVATNILNTKEHSKTTWIYFYFILCTKSQKYGIFYLSMSTLCLNGSIDMFHLLFFFFRDKYYDHRKPLVEATRIKKLPKSPNFEEPLPKIPKKDFSKRLFIKYISKFD